MHTPTTQGNTELVELVISWVVTTGLSFAIVIADERRLSEERLERAWTPASRSAALVAFGVLALPVHFMRTRGHLRNLRGVLGYPLGLVLGVLALAAIALVTNVLLEAVDSAFEPR